MKIKNILYLLIVLFLVSCQATPTPTAVRQTSLPLHKAIPPKIGQMFGVTPPKDSIWTTWVPWTDVEAYAGALYNWDAVDKKLALAEESESTVQFQILFYTSDINSSGTKYFINYTPSGYDKGYELTSGNLSATIPAYDSQAWRNAYWKMIQAFAERYDNDPRLNSFVIAVGIDGETQWIKDAGADWQVEARKISGLEYRYGQFVYLSMDQAAGVFNNTRLFLNNAPGGNARIDRARYAADRGIGLKHSGMLPDINSAKGYGEQIGSWDAMNAFQGQTPLWWESAYGLGDASTRYFGYYAGLTFHPAAMDVHPEWITQIDPIFKLWVEDHLGKTISTTPSVWCVLRDKEYPKVMWSSTEGVSGWPGNFNYWMTVEGAQIVERKNIPGNNTAWQARQAGYITEASVDVNDKFTREKYFLKLILQTTEDSSLTVSWHGNSYELPLDQRALNSWETFIIPLEDFTVDSAKDIVLEGKAYVHLIEVYGDSNIVMPTVTALPTTTVRPTNTIIPTSTVIPTRTIIPTTTSIVIKTTTPRPTSTKTIKEDMSELKKRIYNEWGLLVEFQLVVNTDSR